MQPPYLQARLAGLTTPRRNLLTDITSSPSEWQDERARLIADAEAARAEADALREIDRQRSDLIANIAHDLRSPLAEIIAYCDLMLREVDGPLNQAQTEYCRSVRQAGQRLIDMIQGLLDLSRLASGRLQLECEPVAVGPVVRQALQEMERLAPQQGLKFSLSIDPALPPALADEERLRQALCQLIGNAIKFSRPGGGVTVEAHPLGEMVRVRVLDTGIGLDPSQIDLIWEQFYRVDSPETRGIPGAGIGLPVVRGIIALMGGETGAESPGPGRGATFWLTLPAVREQEE